MADRHRQESRRRAICRPANLGRQRSSAVLAVPRPGPDLLLLFASPWMGNLARHDQDLIPSQSLDKLLEMYHGERVFHWANWGGYLTWHGWDCHPRFKTWIDDRLDIHGQEATERYRAVIQARPGWEGALRAYGVELLCIPPGSPLCVRRSREPELASRLRGR